MSYDADADDDCSSEKIHFHLLGNFCGSTHTPGMYACIHLGEEGV